jgi:hypothetical protein
MTQKQLAEKALHAKLANGESAADLDPILSPDDMCKEAGISRATWERVFRHSLPITHLSPRRVGCRQSVWRAALAARTHYSVPQVA